MARFEDRPVPGANGALVASFRVRIANGVETVLARTTYDATGRVSSYTGGDGLVTEYTCDGRGRLIETRRRGRDRAIHHSTCRRSSHRTRFQPAQSWVVRFFPMAKVLDVSEHGLSSS